MRRGVGAGEPRLGQVQVSIPHQLLLAVGLTHVRPPRTRSAEWGPTAQLPFSGLGCGDSARPGLQEGIANPAYLMWVHKQRGHSSSPRVEGLAGLLHGKPEHGGLATRTTSISALQTCRWKLSACQAPSMHPAPHKCWVLCEFGSARLAGRKSGFSS